MKKGSGTTEIFYCYLAKILSCLSFMGRNCDSPCTTNHKKDLFTLRGKLVTNQGLFETTIDTDVRLLIYIIQEIKTST
jgi:hypothetical protein